VKTDRFLSLTKTYCVLLKGGELHVRSRPGVGVRWLVKHATVDGKGELGSVKLSDEVTAYFDSNGAASSGESCVLFPSYDLAGVEDAKPGDRVEFHIAGPVVFVCWKAGSSSEAVVNVSQVMAIRLETVSQDPVGFIHPLWPTLQ
jgi:hypothetical protein